MKLYVQWPRVNKQKRKKLYVITVNLTLFQEEKQNELISWEKYNN